jgi:hypothetical protein
MMKVVMLVVLAPLSGCSFLQEPYPGWRVSRIQFGELPSVIRKKFEETNPGKVIVEKKAPSLAGYRDIQSCFEHHI